MRLLTADGFVGINPEAKHGSSGDYVKTRLGTKEYSDSETVWYNAIIYGKLAGLVLKKVKKGDSIIVSGTLLKGRNGKEDDTIVVTEFSWSKAKNNKPEPKQNVDEEFNFDAYDEIPFS